MLDSASFETDKTGRFSHHDKTKDIEKGVQRVYLGIKTRDPGQHDFIQSVAEVIFSLTPLFQRHPHYLAVAQTVFEPEMQHMFRVTWMDDKGQQQINRGYRVQFSNALGPYKGGLRFHPSVDLSVVKFLAFEQVFKNALTGLPIGGGKGGSDFDPKGKSEVEIMRFCQAFMMGLQHYVGPNRDVPAGDIGVGARELGYMYGMYKRLTGEYNGVLTGKDVKWGGSLLRPEATGYGVVYFAQHLLGGAGKSIEGLACIVSGSGNVSTFCAQKLIAKGAKVMTLSDTSGYVFFKDGLSDEMLAEVMDLKENRRERISKLCEKFKEVQFVPNKKVWEVSGDVAFPCATQNEIDKEDAKVLVSNAILAVVEGANMPCTTEAMEYFEQRKILFGPAKAANAGGVSVSALEMSQNAMRVTWSLEEVDQKLKNIMRDIYERCRTTAEEYASPGNMVLGANIWGFKRVADAIIEQGCV